MPEQKILKEMRQVLALAENAAATEHERANAYKRLQKLIESSASIHITDALQEQRRARVAISKGPSSTT